MPPKAAAPSTSRNQSEETVLHAVVLADAYGHEFGPLALGARGTEDLDPEAQGVKGKARASPWCLLPLANSPLLAWTLEALSASGVNKAFVFVNEGLEDVRAWFESSSFAKGSSLQVIIRPTTAVTEGDALREVDALAIPSDFILTSVGYVGNLNLKAVVEQFGEKRKKDRGLVMDCLLTPTRLDSPMDRSVYALSETGQLLHYETNPLFPKPHRTKLPRALFEGGKQIFLRTDLETIGVDICSPEVPPLFSENFDYQSIRPHFVVGVLTSDLLGKTISCTVLGESSSRPAHALTCGMLVNNPRTFALVSKSVLSRFLYPIVPDEFLPGIDFRYEMRKDRVYLGQPVNLARSAVVSYSLIGQRGQVDDKSIITGCTVGKYSIIGASCTITNSFLFDDVRIGDGCTIVDSIIGPGVRIGAHSHIRRGSLIGPGVELGEGAIVTDANVSTTPWPTEVTKRSDVFLGKGAEAFIWPTYVTDEDESDDEWDERNLGLPRLGHRPVDFDSSSSASVSSLSRSSSEASLATSLHSTAEPPPVANVASLAGADDVMSSINLIQEVTATLDRAFEDDLGIDDIAIELRTLRMASNVQLSQVRDIVVGHICRRFNRPAKATSVKTALSSHIERWASLVTRLSSNSEQDMVEDILAIQTYCAEAPSDRRELFPLFLHAFYDHDVVTEDALIAWVKSPRSRSIAADDGGKLRLLGAKFVKALVEADEESEEDSD